jgi:hypothetical protein
MWEAADVQWWWRRPRATDELALPVWFDDVGPVAAAGLTAWPDTWQADVFAVPSMVDGGEVWAATLQATAGHRGEGLRVLVREDDAPLVDLAIQSGFAMTDERSGTTWMDAEGRPPIAHVDGFAIVDRVERAEHDHHEHEPDQCGWYQETSNLVNYRRVADLPGDRVALGETFAAKRRGFLIFDLFGGHSSLLGHDPHNDFLFGPLGEIFVGGVVGLVA